MKISRGLDLVIGLVYQSLRVISCSYSYVEFLMLNTPKCDLILRQGLYRVNQMRSNMMGVLIKRGKLNPGAHIKGRSYKKDTEKIIIYKPKRKAWNTSISHSLQINHATCWVWISSLQNCKTITFCCIATHCVLLCHSNFRKLIYLHDRDFHPPQYNQVS